MTTPLIKTASDEALEMVLKNAQADLPGTAPFSAQRAEAIATFEGVGLPNKRVEDWKYSDLKRVMPTDLALAGTPDEAAIAERIGESRLLKDIERQRLVLVNGAYRADLSDLGLLDGKVSIRSVAEALQSGTFNLDDPDITEDDVALSLNTALLQDGVIIDVADGTKIEMPIEICNMMLGGGMASLRNRVVLGEGAELSIIETFIGDNQSYQLNSAIDYRVADGATLNVLRLLRDGDEAIHIGSTTMTLGAKSYVEHFTMAVGGKFVRSQSFVEFNGELSDAEMFGASFVDGNRHSDITLKVDHRVPNCNSKEQYRTVLDGRAEGVFQGKIYVRQPAQKSDAQMMSQALLLSEDAAFFNKPELEIYADDVICAHGATCGELDEELLFYLRARGIPFEQAKKMLVLAFLAEAVEKISNESFVEALESYIAERLGVDY